jgi:hypothetical protein
MYRVNLNDLKNNKISIPKGNVYICEFEMQIIHKDKDEVISPMFRFVGNWFANGLTCSLSRDKVSVKTKPQVIFVAQAGTKCSKCVLPRYLCYVIKVQTLPNFRAPVAINVIS